MVLVQGSPCGKVIFSSCSFREAAFAESQDMLQPGAPESMEKAIMSVWVFLYSVLLMETFSASIVSARAAVCAQETGNFFPCPRSSQKQVNRSPVLELAQQGWLWRRAEAGMGLLVLELCAEGAVGKRGCSWVPKRCSAQGA